MSANKDNPNLIGYMFGNELPYDQLEGVILSADAAASGTRAYLAQWLQTRYSTISAFNTAWGTNYGSFAALGSGTVPMNTLAAGADMDAFRQLYLNEEYGSIVKYGKKYDPNHMQVGDRWLASAMNNSGLATALAKAAGYAGLDAITYNYYASVLDVNRLQEVYDASANDGANPAVPIILSEWHYIDVSVCGSASPVANPEAKGMMYRDYVERAAASGYVVGSDWFTWIDQAPTGRYFEGLNGEASAQGLVDVTDRPYTSTIDQVTQTNFNIYNVVLGIDEPYQAPGTDKSGRDTSKILQVPNAAGEITIGGFSDWSGFAAESSITGIDQAIGMIPPDPNISGDMYTAWDDTNFYIQAHIYKPLPVINTGVGQWWAYDGDGLELFFGPDLPEQKTGNLLPTDSQLMLSVNQNGGDLDAGYYWYTGKNAGANSDTGVVVRAKLDDAGTGYIIEASIPLSAIGLADAADGTLVRYDMGFDCADKSGHRSSQYLWNGVDGDSANRDFWGLATFVNELPSQSVLTGMTVTAQPKLAYTETDKLDLSALTVTLTYSDGSERTVAYADFAAEGLTTAYSNGKAAASGDVLTAAGYNGLTIVVTDGDLTAQTGALSVAINASYDVNGDGKIDSADLALIMANLNKKASTNAVTKKCDVDGNGMVDINDYALVAAYIAAMAAAQ